MTRLPAFTGTVRVDQGVARVLLAGDADLFSAPVLTDVLERAVASNAPVVVLDMALVSFCDARALGLLVATALHLRELGRQCSVQGAPPWLRRLCRITGLTEALQVQVQTDAEDALAADLLEAARASQTRSVLDSALKLVVVMSQAVMAGADGVSLTLPRGGRLGTVAASDDVVLQMDHDQYDTGQGPCLDAATHGSSYTSSSLDQEPRWPQFVPRARARGIASIMSTPLLDGARPLGALNVYSRAPAALADHEQQWAQQFAQQASTVLMAASTTRSVDVIQDDILTALESREVIALAQGVIMTAQKLTPEGALSFLIGISRRTSKPLRSICQEVLTATSPARRTSLSGRPGRTGGDSG